MWSVQALIVSLILLPGFLARAIVAALSPRKELSEFNSIIESVIISFFIYVLALFIIPRSVSNLVTQIITPDAGTFLNDVRPTLIFSLTCSIIIGLFWAINTQNDLIHLKLRKWKLTSLTSRPTTWLDIFYSQHRRYAIVNLHDGRRIFGYPFLVSRDEKEGIIFLTEPAWLENDKEPRSLDVNGILIMPKEYSSIEFLLTKEEFEKKDAK